MKKVQFKTNIKCSACIATVTPELDKAAGNNNWSVDIQHPDKILTVHLDRSNEDEIRGAVEKAGYRAEKLA